MYSFKIGIISDLLHLPFEESVQICSELGADGIQMYAVDGEISPDSITKDIIASRRGVLSRHDMKVSAICGDLGGYGFCRAEDNPRKIEMTKRIVNIATEFNAHVVTTHIGVIPEDDTCERYKVMQEACNKLGEFSQKAGVVLAIETGPEPASRLKSFLDNLNTKGIAVNLDPANLLMVTDDDPVKAVYTLKDYIVHTHAKDGRMIKKTDPQIIYDYFATGGIEDIHMSDYFIEEPLGFGDVDFGAYLEALNNIGYKGFLTIEREVGANAQEDIKNAVDFLRARVSDLRR